MNVRQISALPKGTAFIRAACAMALAESQQKDAITIAARWRDTPSTVDCLKSAVSAGTTTDSVWGGPLFYSDAASLDFAELLRDGSIAGRLPLRAVPFATRYVKQTVGANFAWVGQGAPVPVSSGQFTTGSLAPAKMGGIQVITLELAALSDPKAEVVVRNDLLKGAIEFLDAQFIDPAVAAVANVSPASITNGITPTQSTGSTATQIAADLATLGTTMADNNETDSLFWIMTRADAVRLAAKRDTAGSAAFPLVTVNGGSLLGIPVVVSNAVPHAVSAGSVVVLVNASGIDYADLGTVSLDVSTKATLMMDGVPTDNAATGTGTAQVSMFDTNCAAVKITSYKNWQRTRDTAVTYLDNVHW